jgi:hypothetical protein
MRQNTDSLMRKTCSICLIFACDRHPELQIEQYLVLDVIIGHAVRQGWLEKYPERADKRFFQKTLIKPEEITRFITFYLKKRSPQKKICCQTYKKVIYSKKY